MNEINSIWLVDDDEVYQYITTTYINIANVTKNVDSFTNAEEALEQLKKGQFPDIILLDINMPVMDGWTFMDEYLKIKSDIDHSINIFLVTSSVDTKDKDKAKGYEDIRDFIVKPVDDNTIKRIVDKV